jgi:preprotein translocase subunit SecE
MEDKIIAYRKNIRNLAFVLGVLVNLVSIFMLSQGYVKVLTFGIPYFILVFILHRYWDYFSDSYYELTDNVTWPEWAEVQRLTIVVALFSVLFALATWGVDELCSRTIASFFKLIKG